MARSEDKSDGIGEALVAALGFDDDSESDSTEVIDYFDTSNQTSDDDADAKSSDVDVVGDKKANSDSDKKADSDNTVSDSNVTSGKSENAGSKNTNKASNNSKKKNRKNKKAKNKSKVVSEAAAKDDQKSKKASETETKENLDLDENQNSLSQSKDNASADDKLSNAETESGSKSKKKKGKEPVNKIDLDEDTAVETDKSDKSSEKSGSDPTMPPPGRPTKGKASQRPGVEKQGKGALSKQRNKISESTKDIVKATKESSLVEKGNLGSQILAGGLINQRPTRLKARKVRRVVRHIDPWSVLAFSAVFHVVVIGSLFIGGLIIFVVASWFGMIDNLEGFIEQIGEYNTYEIKLFPLAKAMAIFSVIMILVSSIFLVLLTVIFNLISDLVGGIRVTVVEEDIIAENPKVDQVVS